MKVLLILSLVFVGVWAEPRHREYDPPRPTPRSRHDSDGIMNDPPKPTPPKPRHESDGILNDPSRPAPPPPSSKPKLNPEALPRRYTNDGTPLWQGDLVLTQDQVDYLYGPINTRKAIDDVLKRWTNGVVSFTISPSSAQDRQAILAGLRHWSDNSCIRFTEVQPGAALPHLIFRKLDGCWSSVGMQYNQHGQNISIGENCEGMGTVAHEVGHALGFYHEQSRPDRNRHVKLLDLNINRTMKYNFDIQNNINSYGVQYDLRSLMHYGLDYFTVNGRNTMVPIDIHKTFEIGQRDSLSFYDLKLASIMYNCAANCPSKPSCQNEGFVDHNCRCRCPKGFSGPLCQTRVNLPGPICGGDLTAPATITTPNYPRKYAKGNNCIWLFKAPAGKRINAYFPHFDLIQHNHDTGACSWDNLEVRTNNMDDGEKYCAKDLDGMQITSGGNQMALLFKAEYDWNTGFQAVVTFV